MHDGYHDPQMLSVVFFVVVVVVVVVVVFLNLTSNVKIQSSGTNQHFSVDCVYENENNHLFMFYTPEKCLRNYGDDTMENKKEKQI